MPSEDKMETDAVEGGGSNSNVAKLAAMEVDVSTASPAENPEENKGTNGSRSVALSSSHMASISAGSLSACTSPGTPRGGGEPGSNGGAGTAGGGGGGGGGGSGKKAASLNSPRGYKRKGHSFGDDDDDDDEEASWNRAQRTAEKLAQVCNYVQNR